MKIEALEVSSHIATFSGELICNGIYNNALNFLGQSQQLITIHRQGKGLSPMGWVLTDTDFNQVSQYIQPNMPIISNGRQLLIPPSLYLVSQYYTDLSIPYTPFTNLQKFENLLPLLPEDISTGLYGKLTNYRHIIEQEESLELIQVFSEWLSGQSINWQNYLGRGPGLTPSSDDMLIGMLFSAFVCAKERIQQLSPFFKDTPDLSLLTTTVSQNYLRYASQGIFSSYLVNLAQKVTNDEDCMHALFELLTVGHHSGADTLLGIGLGYHAVKRCNDH